MHTIGYYAALVIEYRTKAPVYRVIENHLISREQRFSTHDEAMDWAEIHAPVIEVPENCEGLEVRGAYIEIKQHPGEAETESIVICRSRHDWMNDEEYHRAAQANEIAAEKAVARYFEDRGWMDTFEEEDRRWHRGY
ncbi:TPA: hypothetical protein ACGQ50_000794 [Enterobacter cloacae]